jgi:hypothetical protein
MRIHDWRQLCQSFELGKAVLSLAKQAVSSF